MMILYNHPPNFDGKIFISITDILYPFMGFTESKITMATRIGSTFFLNNQDTSHTKEYGFAKTNK